MRRQLALAAAAISSLIVLAFVVPLGLLVATLAEDRAVANGERQAQLVVPALASSTGRGELETFIAALPRDGDDVITVFLADGTAVGDDAAPDAEVELARAAGRAFTAEAPAGRQVLVPVNDGSGVQVIRVFVSDDDLRRGVLAAWSVLGLLGLLLVAVATAVADRMGRAIVRPVDALADTAERLGHGELDARVEVEGPPEIREVGHTLNRLATRIGELLETERQTGADLSHRLRTPITALRLDVDALDEGERKDRLIGDVDELTRAVDRLITDARRTVRVGVGVTTDLAAVARDRVAFWSVLADEQGRPYSIEVPDRPVAVAVPADDLAAAVDAVLGNVFAHTSEGVGFRVRVRGSDADRGARGPSLVIEDDGGGWPSFDVFERGDSGAGSTGLGLDIVRRTVESTGGRVELGSASSGHGARLTATFGDGVGGGAAPTDGSERD